METHEIAARLRERVERAAQLLRSVSEAEAARQPAPGKWSKKEILGHLVDSASNNHQRFVRARFQDELVFPGYEQDDWVAAEVLVTQASSVGGSNPVWVPVEEATIVPPGERLR